MLYYPHKLDKGQSVVEIEMIEYYLSGCSTSFVHILLDAHRIQHIKVSKRIVGLLGGAQWADSIGEMWWVGVRCSNSSFKPLYRLSTTFCNTNSMLRKIKIYQRCHAYIYLVYVSMQMRRQMETIRASYGFTKANSLQNHF